MIACVCKNVSDKKIKKAVKDGTISSLKDAVIELEVCIECGCCAKYINELVKEELQNNIKDKINVK